MKEITAKIKEMKLNIKEDIYSIDTLMALAKMNNVKLNKLQAILIHRQMIESFI